MSGGPDDPLVILSYGGGLNSTALLVKMVEAGDPLDLVVFADTGDENGYTYEAVDYYRQWSESRGVEFVSIEAGYGMGIYDYYWENRAVPSVSRRDCTSKFKIKPMRRYLRGRYGTKVRFKMLIGIAIDEGHRVRDSDVKYITNDFPLVWSNVTRVGCEEILVESGLPVPQKSGCWFCPYQSNSYWKHLYNKDRESFIKAMALEENGSRYPEITLRPGVNLRAIHDYWQGQGSLLSFGDPGDSIEPPCDVSGSCFL